LQISSISFIRCGLEITSDLQYAHTDQPQFDYYVQAQVALLLVECSTVLENVRVMYSYGYGLLGYNVMMAKLTHSLFQHNYWRKWEESNTQYSSSNNSNQSEIQAGGNALFKYNSRLWWYRSLPIFHKSTTVTLNILHSEFAHGRNQFELSSATSVHGGGLGIDMTSPVNTVNITVYNCSMHKKHRFSWSKYVFFLFTSHCTVQ